MRNVQRQLTAPIRAIVGRVVVIVDRDFSRAKDACFRAGTGLTQAARGSQPAGSFGLPEHCGSKVKGFSPARLQPM